MNRHFSEDIYVANKHEENLIITGHQRNANQNHKEIPAHLNWNGDHEWKTTDAGEDVERQECFYIVGGSVSQFNHCGRCEAIPQGSRTRNTI